MSNIGNQVTWTHVVGPPRLIYMTEDGTLRELGHDLPTLHSKRDIAIMKALLRLTLDQLEEDSDFDEFGL